MNSKEVMYQALDALDSHYPGAWANDALKCHWDGIRKEAITFLRQAIIEDDRAQRQAEQEPVAWMDIKGNVHLRWKDAQIDDGEPLPLYAAPQPAPAAEIAALKASNADLLAALECALEYLETWEDLSTGPHCRQARAAIAQAVQP